MNPRKILRLGILVAAFALSSIASAGEWKVGRLLQDSNLYAKPDATTPAIVRYPRGTQLRAYAPDRGGWIAIYLAKPINGTQYAWIPVRALQLPPSAAPSSSSSAQPNATGAAGLKNGWLSVGESMVMAKPSDYQIGIGEPNATPISLMNIEGEFGYFLSPKIYAVIRGGSFSLSHAQTVITSANYTASGLYGTLGFGFMFVRKPSFALGLEASGGMSLSTVSNATATQQVSTSAITGFPLRGALRGQLRIKSGLGLDLIAGYEMHTLTQIQSFVQTDGSTAYPNMSLGGMVLGARLAYAF